MTAWTIALHNLNMKKLVLLCQLRTGYSIPHHGTASHFTFPHCAARALGFVTAREANWTNSIVGWMDLDSDDAWKTHPKQKGPNDGTPGKLNQSG